MSILSRFKEKAGIGRRGRFAGVQKTNPYARRLHLEHLEERHLLSIVSWDGGGGDLRWNNPLNWLGDQLPGADDEVVISGAGGTIMYDGAVAEIASPDLRNSLLVSDGSILVGGTLSVSTASSLTVSGSSTAFAAQGATTIDGASLYVSAGGFLELNGLTSYTNTVNATRTLRASGAGSVLSLPNVETITGSAGAVNNLFIHSLSGGRVELPALIEVPGGAVQFRADGAESVIELPALESFQGRFFHTQSGFEATNSGTILCGSLTSVATANITLDATGVMDTAQIESYTGSGTLSISGAERDFSKLKTLGSVMVSVLPGAGLAINPTREPWSASGVFLASGTSLVLQNSPWIDAESVTVRSSLEVVAGATVDLNATLVFEGSGRLLTAPAATVQLSRGLTGDTKNADVFEPRGVLRLDGQGTESAPQVLEVMGRDRGPIPEGFDRNFAYGTLTVAPGNWVRLVDDFQNWRVLQPEAIYVQSLVVPTGATLDLNGLNLYARAALIDGTILFGNVQVIPDSGRLPLNTSTPGTIDPAGEVDEWEFFGRAGRAVTVLVDPGSGTASAPVAPQLRWVDVQVLSPAGQVLAEANNTALGSGRIVAVENVPLTTDGVYRIRVNAPGSHTSATGNYVLTVWDATTNELRLTPNQSTIGHITTPATVDHWTFAGLVGQQIDFDFLNAAAGVFFRLTGPDGFVAFDGVRSDFAGVTLPSSGNYMLSVYSTDGRRGGYFSEPGDFGKLVALPGGVFEIRELDGTTIRFLANGRLDYVQDSNMNRIAAGYSDERLTSLTHSAGPSLLIVYNAAGFIETITDSDGRVTQFGYEDECLTSVTAPSGQLTQYVYNMTGPAATLYALRVMKVDRGLADIMSTYPRGSMASGDRTHAGRRTLT